MDYDGPLELVPLDERGHEYVAARLREGKTLAHALLEGPSLARGSVSSLAAPGLDVDRLYRFNGSAVPQLPRERAVVGPLGAVSLEVVDTTARLIAALGQRLHQGGLVVVGEDWMASASDSWLASNAARPWVFGEEVYFAASAESSPASLKAAVHNGDGAWPGLLLVVCEPEFAHSALWDRDWSISQSAMAELAATATELWVGAYDGESYLLWAQGDDVISSYQRMFASS